MKTLVLPGILTKKYKEKLTIWVTDSILMCSWGDPP